MRIRSVGGWIPFGAVTNEDKVRQWISTVQSPVRDWNSFFNEFAGINNVQIREQLIGLLFERMIEIGGFFEIPFISQEEVFTPFAFDWFKKFIEKRSLEEAAFLYAICENKEAAFRFAQEHPADRKTMQPYLDKAVLTPIHSERFRNVWYLFATSNDQTEILEELVTRLLDQNRFLEHKLSHFGVDLQRIVPTLKERHAYHELMYCMRFLPESDYQEILRYFNTVVLPLFVGCKNVTSLECWVSDIRSLYSEEPRMTQLAVQIQQAIQMINSPLENGDVGIPPETDEESEPEKKGGFVPQQESTSFQQVDAFSEDLSVDDTTLRTRQKTNSEGTRDFTEAPGTVCSGMVEDENMTPLIDLPPAIFIIEGTEGDTQSPGVVPANTEDNGSAAAVESFPTIGSSNGVNRLGEEVKGVAGEKPAVLHMSLSITQAEEDKASVHDIQFVASEISNGAGAYAEARNAGQRSPEVNRSQDDDRKSIGSKRSEMTAASIIEDASQATKNVSQRLAERNSNPEEESMPDIESVTTDSSISAGGLPVALPAGGLPVALPIEHTDGVESVESVDDGDIPDIQDIRSVGTDPSSAASERQGVRSVDQQSESAGSLVSGDWTSTHTDDHLQPVIE